MFPTHLEGFSTTAKGDVAEQAVAFALMAAAKTVLKPISNELRYDLLVDNLDGTFARVQCKTRIIKGDGGTLRFSAYNADGRRPFGVPYQGEVDAFGVYCPQNGCVYFVRIDDVGGITSEVSLRLLPTKSGQIQGTRLAAAYLVGQKERTL